MEIITVDSVSELLHNKKIKVKPIQFLVGKNGSGKKNFLKSMLIALNDSKKFSLVNQPPIEDFIKKNGWYMINKICLKSFGFVFKFLKDTNIITVNYNYNGASALAASDFHYHLLGNTLFPLANAIESQVLNDNPIIMTIEYPEQNLHPEMHKRFIECCVSAIKEASKNELDLRIIITTYSDVMINYTGCLIEDRKIKKSDASAILFHKEPYDIDTKISVTRYDEEGFLINWPLGFMDA